MEKKDIKKFLLIGDGFIAPRHKEAIKEIGGEITGIVDITDGENKWKEAIIKSNAECVVVLTPNDLHFPICRLAAENKKIVLCEKPLAIKSKDVENLFGYENIFTVLQLRHHPDVLKIRQETEGHGENKIEMDISVYRDENYYSGWKGKKERSGGPLFNLGIHYFDLLIYLFGEPRKVFTETLDDKTGAGTIEGDNYVCHFRVSTGEKRHSQRRVFKINGKNYNFSSKDNLSFENLHRFVYQDLINGTGVNPAEAYKSIKLVENLYNSHEKGEILEA